MSYLVNLEVDDEVVARVDAAALMAMIERVLGEDEVPDGSGLALVLTEDSLLQELNLRHRDVDAPTDVLSFPANEGEPFPQPDGEAPYLGDIVVSVESVERQAADAGLTAAEELAHVVLHGVLHLLGYDHEEADEEAVMQAREEAVLGPDIHAGRAAHND
ncbi:MAG: rRNA maturation RNase YbeY [Chloroflexi bacterium]|nr:rRNA maturation RNase YbeY [Chloroflexota bacterium]MQC47634.1 rRNA maturation RNase YbeY [Chloroflexota bacterium]